MMKKRLLSLALSFVMLLTMLPVSVWAEEDVTTLATVADTEIAVVNGGNEADNDALFMDYLYRLAGADQTEVQSIMVDSLDSDDYETISHPAMMTASNFSPTSAAFYSKLKERVEAIAAEGGSTVINIVFSKTYTAEELNVPRVNIMEGVSGAMERFHQDTGISYTQNGNLFSLGDDLDTEAVLNEIVFTDPISLYWYDKTVGSYIQKGYGYSWDKNVDAPQEITIEVNAAYYMCVATEFRPNPAGYYQLNGTDYYCEVDGSKTTAAKSAVAAAQGVVEENKNGSDSEKLRAYLDYICGAVSYNSAALSNTPYGNPWQLIYVFDNKSSTNVVCEGYAKAFKFLCDLSTWSDSDFECILVTGQMDGGTGAGNHMWNLVHLQDGNYLVDPTNCDQGTSGAPDKLFLREWEKGTFTYSFTNPTISYTYDDTTKSTFLPEELMLKGEPSLLWQWGYLENGAFVLTNEPPTNEFEVELYQEFRGRLIFRDPEGKETVLHPTTEGLSIEPEDFLEGKEYDEKTGFLCLAAVAPGEAIISYGGVELMVHSAIPPVGFYKTTELGEDDYLGVWDYDGVNTTVYLASTDENIVLKKVAPADETVIVGEKTGNCFPVTVNDLHSSRITLYLSGSVWDGDHWVTVEDQEIELWIHDVRPGLVWHWLDDGEGYWQETGVDRYWEEWLGNEPMGYLYYRDANGVETQLSDEKVAALSFEGLQYGLERDEGDSHSRIHLLFDRLGSATISPAEGLPVVVRVEMPEFGFYADADGEQPLGLWVLDDAGSMTVYLRTPDNYTLTEVHSDNGNEIQYTIENNGHGVGITLTALREDRLRLRLTGTWGNNENTQEEWAEVRIRDRRSGLGFYWMNWDEDELTRDPNQREAERSFREAPGDRRTVQFVFRHYENGAYLETTVGADELTAADDDMVTLKPAEEYEGVTEVEFLAFGDTELQYTVHWGEENETTYTLPITIGLPEVGFYCQPTASRDNFLTEWCYTGSNQVYLVWPEDAESVEVTFRDNSRTKAAAEVMDGYAVVTVTDYQGDDIEAVVTYRREDRNEERDVRLHIEDGRSGLAFYRVEGDWFNDQGPFEVNTEEGAQKALYMTPGGTILVQIVFDDNDTETPLKKDDVTISGIEYRWVGNDTYLLLEAGSVGEATIGYTRDTGDYLLNVHVELPDVGFYSQPEASEANLINEWVYTGQDIYLVIREGDDAIFKSVTCENSDVQITITAIQGQEGKAYELHLEEAADVGQIDLQVTIQRDGPDEQRGLNVGFLRADVVINLAASEGMEDWPRFSLWDSENRFVDHLEVRQVGDVYALVHLNDGTYRLEIAADGCVSSTVEVTVKNGKAADVQTMLIKRGDLNGAANTLGQAVDASDMQCLFEYLSQGNIGGALAEDKAYFRSVADVNEDGLVNILDYQALYEMVKA